MKIQMPIFILLIFSICNAQLFVRNVEVVSGKLYVLCGISENWASREFIACQNGSSWKILVDSIYARYYTESPLWVIDNYLYFNSQNMSYGLSRYSEISGVQKIIDGRYSPFKVGSHLFFNNRDANEAKLYEAVNGDINKIAPCGTNITDTAFSLDNQIYYTAIKYTDYSWDTSNIESFIFKKSSNGYQRVILKINQFAHHYISGGLIKKVNGVYFLFSNPSGDIWENDSTDWEHTLWSTDEYFFSTNMHMYNVEILRNQICTWGFWGLATRVGLNKWEHVDAAMRGDTVIGEIVNAFETNSEVFLVMYGGKVYISKDLKSKFIEATPGNYRKDGVYKLCSDGNVYAAMQDGLFKRSNSSWVKIPINITTAVNTNQVIKPIQNINSSKMYSISGRTINKVNSNKNASGIYLNKVGKSIKIINNITN